MEQTARIAYMEQILDEGIAAMAAPEPAAACQPLRSRLQELFDYYHSPQWLQDLEDGRAGRLPAGLKRGVLSEDAVWNLESSYFDLFDRL